MKIDLGRNKSSSKMRGKLKRLLWEIAWSVAGRITPRWCLNGWRCTLMRMFGARVGRGCIMRNTVSCWRPDNVMLGDNCWIDSDVRLYSADKIKIGSNCVVSAQAFLCTASHDIRSETFELVTAPITLEDCVWVASNAIVLPGVTLHEGCVVGAGAVVSHDVPAWTVVGGNPAREIGKRE